MRQRTILFTAAVLLLFILQTASALEIRQGRIKVRIHEDNGRISVYYLEDIKEERYRSLLFRRDPRTTSLGLLMDNRIVTLGSSAEFEQTIRDQGNGAAIVWENSRFRVTERFRFVRSKEEGLADGIRVDITVRNVSEADRRVGIHYLFDTYLGERQKAHFITAAGDQLTRETEYSRSIPGWWLSPAPDHPFDGMRVTVKGASLTPPDRIVFANWKRLNESTWNMQVQENRNFNLLPYSINDSAVAHFYEARLLSSGEERSVSFILGVGSGYASEEAQADSEENKEKRSVEELTTGEKQGGSALSPEERLLRINDILDAIDNLIEGKEELTGEKLEVLEQELRELQEAQSRSQEQTDTP
jgi:hypothetical protein